jgi:hypothetical protein
MTPKEKSDALVAVMYDVDFWDDDDSHTMQYKHAKQCALRAVDELINYSKEWDDSDYWEQVKQEILLS